MSRIDRLFRRSQELKERKEMDVNQMSPYPPVCPYCKTALFEFYSDAEDDDFDMRDEEEEWAF